MKKLKLTPKITLATLKTFARRNKDHLYCKAVSDFNGMVDMVEQVNGEWIKTAITDNTGYFRTGIQGIYTVGSSRDYFTLYEDEVFIGITVSNSCGKNILVVKKN